MPGRGGESVLRQGPLTPEAPGACAHPTSTVLTLSVPSRQPSSSAAQDSSSAQRASAPTLPSSVMGITTARTTVMRPTAVKRRPPQGLGLGVRAAGHAASPGWAAAPPVGEGSPPCPRAPPTVSHPPLLPPPQTSTSACPVSSSAPTPTAVSPASSAATGRTTAETARTRGTAVSAPGAGRDGGVGERARKHDSPRSPAPASSRDRAALN